MDRVQKGVRHSLVAWFGTRALDPRFIKMAERRQRSTIAGVRHSTTRARMQIFLGGENSAREGLSVINLLRFPAFE